MSTLIERIELRLKKTGQRARGASLRAGLGGDFIRNIRRNPDQKPLYDNLAKLAEALSCNVRWLASGEGQEELSGQPQPKDDVDTQPLGSVRYVQNPKDLPIRGGAMGGDDTFFTQNGEPIGYVARPPSLDGIKEAYAVYMTGDSMEPRYFAGEILQVHPYKPPKAGDFVVIQTCNSDDVHHYFVKRYVRKTAKELICRQYNPDSEVRYKTAEILAIHTIVGSLAEG